jgi:hypothetical protein
VGHIKIPKKKMELSDVDEEQEEEEEDLVEAERLIYG